MTSPDTVKRGMLAHRAVAHVHLERTATSSGITRELRVERDAWDGWNVRGLTRRELTAIDHLARLADRYADLVAHAALLPKGASRDLTKELAKHARAALIQMTEYYAHEWTNPQT